MPKGAGFQISRKFITFFLLFSLIILFDHVGLFNGINSYFYDMYFRLRGPEKPSDQILIIAIDDNTLKEFGKWPLPRSYYASLLDKLKGADVVAFDIIMAEPADDDGLLSEAMQRHGRVILPVYLDDTMHLRYPAARLAPHGVGHVHLEQHIDGVVRDVYHTLLYNGTRLKSLPAVIYETFTGRQADIELKGSPPLSAAQKAITQLNRMKINYAGGPGTFMRVSLADVLNGRYTPSFFQHKICLVGNTAKGLGGQALTPFSKDRKGMPHVEVYANIVNSLLYRNAVRSPVPWMLWACAALLALFALFLSARMTEQGIALLGSIALASVVLTDYVLFSRLQVWIAPAIFCIIIVTTLIATYVFRLNDALSDLDKAYRVLTPHMRWHPRLAESDSYTGRGSTVKGLWGLFTYRGINSRIRLLGSITDQLVFEKKLIEKVMLSDVHGLILFGPDRQNLLINGLADSVARQNFLATSDMEGLIKDLSAFIVDKIDPDHILKGLFAGQEGSSFTVSFPVPKKVFYKVDVSPLYIGNEMYTLLLFADITKIKELEILKGEVVSLISHEIKTPLTSIQGFAEILTSYPAGKEKEFAQIIHDESKRLVRFLNSFLDLARIEEGRKPINLGPVDLSLLVEEAVLAVNPIAAESKIKIDSEIGDAIAPVMIDRDLTKQCIINLVENAIKYSPQGSSITIRLTGLPDHVAIAVEDHGIGIHEEDLDSIFNKFFRSTWTDVKGVEGSGLGLAFVKEAVEAQGGTVTVESSYGKGSTFSILFKRNN